MRIVGGELGGRILRAPRDARTRPMLEKTRAAVFNILGERVLGARVLDAYAGTGSLGLEALSRGAAHAVFVERDRVALGCLERNIEELGVGARSTILRSHAEIPPGPFDLVFVDPPYRDLEDAERRPRTLAMVNDFTARLLAPEGRLVLHFPEGSLEEGDLAAETFRTYGRNGVALMMRPR